MTLNQFSELYVVQSDRNKKYHCLWQYDKGQRLLSEKSATIIYRLTFCTKAYKIDNIIDMISSSNFFKKTFFPQDEYHQTSTLAQDRWQQNFIGYRFTSLDTTTSKPKIPQHNSHKPPSQLNKSLESKTRSRIIQRDRETNHTLVHGKIIRLEQQQNHQNPQNQTKRQPYSLPKLKSQQLFNFLKRSKMTYDRKLIIEKHKQSPNKIKLLELKTKNSLSPSSHYFSCEDYLKSRDRYSKNYLQSLNQKYDIYSKCVTDIAKYGGNSYKSCRVNHQK